MPTHMCQGSAGQANPAAGSAGVWVRVGVRDRSWTRVYNGVKPSDSVSSEGVPSRNVKLLMCCVDVVLTWCVAMSKWWVQSRRCPTFCASGTAPLLSVLGVTMTHFTAVMQPTLQSLTESAMEVCLTHRDCWSVAFGNSYNDEERCVLAGYDNGDVKLFDLRMNKVGPRRHEHHRQLEGVTPLVMHTTGRVTHDVSNITPHINTTSPYLPHCAAYPHPTDHQTTSFVKYIQPPIHNTSSNLRPFRFCCAQAKQNPSERPLCAVAVARACIKGKEVRRCFARPRWKAKKRDALQRS